MVGEGKGEGRIGFLGRQRREGEGMEGPVQKILLRRNNERRCWF